MFDHPVPSRERMIALLAEHAPLTPVPLCPEIRAHYARSLIGVWDAAEQLAGSSLPAPFWAYPWAAGCALARLLLDRPELVRGKRVLDFGAGGGVASIAAAHAGAARVVANDIDATALLVCSIAAQEQGLTVDLLHADLCAEPSKADAFDVVVCSDLSYERSETPRQRAFLDRARLRGAEILVADAGRTYFDATGMELLGEYVVAVPTDLEGTGEKRARVYSVA